MIRRIGRYRFACDLVWDETGDDHVINVQISFDTDTDDFPVSKLHEIAQAIEARLERSEHGPDEIR